MDSSSLDFDLLSELTPPTASPPGSAAEDALDDYAALMENGDVSASSRSPPSIPDGFLAGDDLSYLGAMSPLTLSLIQQKSLVQEPWSQNGASKMVHVCAKNVPFVVTVGGANFDATGCDAAAPWQLHADLFFDGPDDAALTPVLLNKDAMTYRVFVGDKDESGADTVNIEFRIIILSSHHDNNLFRVRISARSTNSVGSEPAEFALIPLVMTEPIRVVSKPMQALRGKKRRTSPSDLEGKRSAASRGAGMSAADRELLTDMSTRLAQLEAGQRKLVTLQEQQQQRLCPPVGFDFERPAEDAIHLQSQQELGSGADDAAMSADGPPPLLESLTQTLRAFAGYSSYSSAAEAVQGALKGADRKTTEAFVAMLCAIQQCNVPQDE